MILDTNVVSEPFRPFPDARVMRWIDQLDVSTCYITVVTVAELLFGAERLPIGKRRDGLLETTRRIIDDQFANRILTFDLVAARHWGAVFQKLQSAGLNGMQMDATIAAIARSKNMPVATRDETPYVAAGVKTINPWTDE